MINYLAVSSRTKIYVCFEITILLLETSLTEIFTYIKYVHKFLFTIALFIIVKKLKSSFMTTSCHGVMLSHH